MDINERYLKGHAAMLTAYIIFGLNIPLSKGLLANDITPFALTFFRMTGAAVLFFVLSLFVKKEKVARKDIFLLFLASLFGIQINQMAFFSGLRMTSAIDASLITILVPIFTMILAAVFLKEPVTWKKALGVLIGATGALWLILNSGYASQGNSSMAGNLLCITSGLSYAVYLTVFRNLIRRYSAITLMKWMFLFAAVCTAPLCWNDVISLDYAGMPWDIWLRLAYVVVFATFVAYLLLPVGQKNMRPTIVSMYNYVQPIVASLIAVTLGLDVFGWSKVQAAILVAVGVYLVLISKSRAQVEAEMRRRHINEIKSNAC